MPQTKLHSAYDEVFLLTPKPLQDACLGKITKEVSTLTDLPLLPQPGDACRQSPNFVQDVVIPDKLAEMMLEEFSKSGKIRNDTLRLFSDVAKYNIKVLRLPLIKMETAGDALLDYAKFSLRELKLGCSFDNIWNIKKLSASFSGSRPTLTSLHLDLCPDVEVMAGSIFDFFVQFPNLKVLKYNTPSSVDKGTFTNRNWNNLLTSCSMLQVLHVNINGTSSDNIELDSEIFKKGTNLKSLSLFSALKSEVAIETYRCVEYFLHLEYIRELDLSVDFEPPDSNLVQLNYNSVTHTDKLASHIDQFLELSVGRVQFLEALDLSGIFRLDDMKLQNFITSHKNLNFLGLCMLQSKFCVNGDVVAFFPDLKIAGCYLESQIIISLLKYSKRGTYMKEVLKGLFQVTAGWTDVRRPYILKIVLEIMENFKGHMHLQMAATACVFHLTKEREGITNELNVQLLSEIARVTSMILVLHSGNLQMVKNCLLIICTDRILHSANFDRVQMSRLCLKCMIDYPESSDRHVTRMAVAIISILACKISSMDTANLMREKEMQLLLDIVEQRLAAKQVDGTLKFDLSALWNLTDESPAACRQFVDLDGPAKYLKLLEVFQDNMQVETKVLGLLNNIAEVEFLQAVMLENRPLMDRIRRLIMNNQVQVSYFACGIVANLALRWDHAKTVLLETEKVDILKELNAAIDRWGTLKSEIVTYRSFKPFFELLGCSMKPEIQRWAVWAIHHVCTLCSHLYKGLMGSKCLELLYAIYMQHDNEMRMKIKEIFQNTGYAHLLYGDENMDANGDVNVDEIDEACGYAMTSPEFMADVRPNDSVIESNEAMDEG